MGDSSRAVFLSYASQDAETARRICDALRTAGVEVWFDQSELRGGDAWDQKIRRQIKECVLFVPIISANTQSRLEGYFRLEWKLAEDRSHLMAKGRPFILPVCIDDTKDWDAQVPDAFMVVQWTRLPGGEASAAFCDRVKVLLGGSHVRAALRPDDNSHAPRSGLKASPISRRRWLALGIAAAVMVGALALWQPWTKPMSAAMKVAPSGTAASTPLTEAQKLTRQARALIDDDFLAVRENFRLAEELCQRATTLDPSDGEAWATWARVSLAMQARNYDSSAARREAARSQVERAIRLAPSSVEAGLAVAAHALHLNDTAEAERRYRLVLTTAPREPRAAIGLANALEAGGKVSEASEIRLNHPAFASRHPVPLVDEARRLRFRGQLMEAEALLERAHAIAPTTGGYHAKLIILANFWGDVPAAVDYLKQIPLRLRQEDAIAALSAWVWMRAGNGEEALKAMARVPREFIHESLQVSPKSWVTGWAQTVAGRPAAARAEWTEALAVVEKRLVTEPNEPRLLNLKALLLALTGRTEPAEQTWKLYREFTGRRASAMDEVEFCCALGRHEEAIGHLQSWWRSDASRAWIASWNNLRFEPRFAAIRNDARVQSIIAEMVARIDALRRPASAMTSSNREAVTTNPAAADKSIAVLPFVNLGADKNDEYLGDGLTEELLSALSQIKTLRVPGRSSCFAFKGKTGDDLYRQIGEKLQVKTVLEGTVRKVGEKLRITAQLINAADGTTLWSKPYDGDMKDILAVQTEVARRVVETLQLQLGVNEARALAKPTENSEAHRLYLLGRYHFGKGTEAGWAVAEKHFQQAIQSDPNYAPAYCGLADYYGFAGGIMLAGRAAWSRQREFAEKALRIEPNLAEGHFSLGSALASTFEWERAEIEMKRSLELNPNLALVRDQYAWVLVSLGRSAEAIAEARKAIELDPYSPLINADLAAWLYMAGRPEEAIAQVRKAMELDSNSPFAYANLGLCLIAKGDGPGAVAALLKAKSLDANPWFEGWLGYAYAVNGERAKAAQILQEIEQLAEKRYVSPSVRTSVYLGLGETTKALDWLEKCYDEQDSVCCWMKVFPLFDSVRAEPRFQALLTKVGLDQ